MAKAARFWTLYAEEMLIDLMVEASVNGCFLFGKSNKKVLSQMTSKLTRQAGETLTVTDVLIKLNELSWRHYLWQWVSSQRGVSWDPVSKLLVATEEVWMAIIKEKPKAAVYKFTAEKHGIALTMIFSSPLRVDCTSAYEANINNASNTNVNNQVDAMGDTQFVMLSDEDVNIKNGESNHHANNMPIDVDGPGHEGQAKTNDCEMGDYSTGSSPFPLKFASL